MIPAFTMCGVGLGTTESDLVALGWERTEVKKYGDTTRINYDLGKYGSSIIEGVVIEVFGPTLSLNGSVLLESGQLLDQDRFDLLNKLGITEVKRRGKFPHAAHQRFNFEGWGLALLVNEDRIATIMLQRKLLKSGGAKGLFGFVIDMSV